MFICKSQNVSALGGAVNIERDRVEVLHPDVR
jgi:hypothetical protein